MADTPEGCPAIQTNLNRTQKWTKRPWSSAKGNVKSCILEGIIPWTRLGTDWLEGSLADKDLVDKKLNMNKQCATEAKKKKKQPASWAALGRLLQIEGSDPLPLFSTGEGTPGGLCPALGCQLQERHDNAGKSSARGLKDD